MGPSPSDDPSALAINAVSGHLPARGLALPPSLHRPGPKCAPDKGESCASSVLPPTSAIAHQCMRVSQGFKTLLVCD